MDLIDFLGVEGSSPRGRGKPRKRGARGGKSGLIPAWAGKTTRPDRVEAGEGAHPRVGGENSRSPLMRAVLAGSSPRGRGKLSQEDRTQLRDGLIPAWAGKT